MEDVHLEGQKAGGGGQKSYTGAPCAPAGALGPRSPLVTQGRAERLHSRATYGYKGSALSPRRHHASSGPPAPTCVTSDSSRSLSAHHGPQLLLRCRWLLLLRWLLHLQRVQMHLLQEELLLLLPRGLCQMRPGLRLQRGF
ncbi:hypothetical protein H920_11649 [Fukomys damarensis]|uniref:Uncharacterized protein n=1 Tax=Fukomys damarensis TaxID=885580 RepID=A0A091DVY1_FUKDA|nr:hypothetical protein H920_11649 [Fukomys damarensis]